MSDNTIYEQFLKSVQTYNKKIYINEYTYEQIGTKISQMSNVLKQMGLIHGKRIGLQLYNSLEFVILFYTLIKNAVTVVLINPEISRSQLECLLNKAEATLLFTEHEDKLQNIKIIPRYNLLSDVSISMLMEKCNSTPAESIEDYLENRVPVIQCSSGTTGTPKIAIRNSDCIKNDIDNIIETYEYTSQDVIYCTVPIYHGFGLTMALLSGTQAGAAVILKRWMIAKSFLKDYENLGPTIILGIPESYNVLTNSGIDCQISSHTRYLFCSGEVLTEKVALGFHDKFKRWLNLMYGMMEASTISANIHPGQSNYLSVGTTAKNVFIDIKDMDADGNGKIFIKSASLSYEYLGGKKLTDNEWFYTGDIGRICESGDLYLINREKG